MSNQKELMHIIVQAGGKGTRLKHHTYNKPKCLVSINGKPMLYNVFEKFPNSVFYVIGDYHYETLERYIEVFKPSVEVKLLRASGSGTCSGIQQARDLLPTDTTPFSLIWSDLQFNQEVNIPTGNGNFIGITDQFPCRWSVQNGELCETSSDQTGIAGMFYFGTPSVLPKIPESGEFVRFLKENEVKLDTFMIGDCYEVGTMDKFSVYKNNGVVTRFFNELKINEVEGTVIKKAKIPEYQKLIDREINWYRKLADYKYQHVPNLIDENPMTIEYINGVHPFELNINDKEREKVLYNIINKLKEMHNLEKKPFVYEDFKKEYLDKTVSRFNDVREFLPFNDYEFLIVNNKKVMNLFHNNHFYKLEEIFKDLPQEDFGVIHGDSTFSNILVDQQLESYLFDPRGYFGNSYVFGDPNYDFYKLYYSLVGNYDQFNRRDFALKILQNQVELELPKTKWASYEGIFLQETGLDKRAVMFAHGLIWISLAGYAVDDIDSIYGAYVKGLEVLSDGYQL